MPRALAQSAVAVPHTGDTTETVLATVVIPAGAMGPNGQVEIETLWSMPNNANNKTVKIKFGATAVQTIVLTTVLSAQYRARVSNRGATNSQVAASTAISGLGSIAAAAITPAIDTTAAVAITILGTVANAADTITLESYIVKLFPKA